MVNHQTRGIDMNLWFLRHVDMVLNDNNGCFSKQDWGQNQRSIQVGNVPDMKDCLKLRTPEK